MSRAAKRGLIAGGVLLIAAVVVYLFVFGNREADRLPHESLGKLYDADGEIADSLLRLSKGTKPAEILSGADTTDKVVALTFEGTLEQEQAEALLNLLKEYNMPAVFFLPGVTGAEDPDTVRKVALLQTVGNYSMAPTEGLEKLEADAQVEDLSRTSAILKQITGSAPTLFKGSRTEYTDALLRSAGASGLQYAVESGYYLNDKSFPVQKAADEFVRGIHGGAILSVKTEGALSEDEYDLGRPITTQTPAIDPEATLDTQKQEPVQKPDLIAQVEYLLRALKEQGYQGVSLTALSSYSDKDFDMNFTTEREQNAGHLAAVYGRISTSQPYAAYSFRGIGDGEMLDKVLKLLKENGSKATFFVTGQELVSYPDRARRILNEGHALGNGGMTGKSLENSTFREICFEIYKCDKILKEDYLVYTPAFMPAYGKYNDLMREAASTLGYSIFTYSKLPVTDSNATPEDILKKFGSVIRSGEVIHFRLDYYDRLDTVLTEISRRASASGKTVVDVYTLYRSRGGAAVSKPKPQAPSSWLKVDTTPGDYKKLLTQNNAVRALKVAQVYTTQPAAAYIFRGISNADNVNAVLNALDDLNSKATFFITAKEIERYPETVEAIRARGHQLANGGYDKKSLDTAKLTPEDVCYDIDMGERYLKAYLGSAYGAANKYYMPGFSQSVEAVQEAVSAMGYPQVVSYSRSMTTTAYKDLPADEILSKYFHNTLSLQQGDIIYFKLDYLSQPGAVESLVYQTAQRYLKNVPYAVTTVGDLLGNPLVYSALSRAEAVKNSPIHDSHGLSSDEITALIHYGYIGNPDIDGTSLTGFTAEQTLQIDKTGKINTNGEKVIFLTFDDWGSDVAIQKLLRVLDKYDTKASFFVRVGTDKTPYDSPIGNPNLLRSIALAGHDVASHTFTHMKVNIEGEADQAKLQTELTSAYGEMARYIGDTGRLQRYFRPPTLAISRLGMETIFGSGHNYIINGDFSTHDYEAANAADLTYQLLNGQPIPYDQENPVRRIGDGSIVVMHMSDEAQYTAASLDKVIPFYQSLGYRFARLSEYLK